MTTDRLDPASWTFADMGPDFDTHVAAHLPGYADVQRLVALVASHVVPEGGTVADLGCATGLTAETIHNALLERRIIFDLYDADRSMLDAAVKRMPGARLHHSKLPDGLTHNDASLTVALWFLQFLNPEHRRPLLRSARMRSAPSGAILVATKTRHADSRWEEIAVSALDDYKAEQGVSAEERAAKTRALRGVLTTTTAGQVQLDLKAAGWHQPIILWRWHVWSIIGAWASPQGEERP